MVSLAGGEFDENVWGGRLRVILGGDLSVEKKNERATGPWILMASAGWGDTTPQRSSVAFLAGKKKHLFFSEETSHIVKIVP